MSKVRSSFVALFFVMSLLVVLVSGEAFAQVKIPQVPATNDCTVHLCNNSLQWPGTVYGGQWTEQASFPRLRNVSSDYWHKFWLMSDKSENDPAQVILGMEEVPPGGTDQCGVSHGSSFYLGYYDEVTDSHGSVNTPKCHPVPSGDVNYQTLFLFTTDPRQFSTGCGVLVRFYNFHTGTLIRDEYLCDPTTNFPPYDPEYGSTGKSETLHTVIATGVHAIWGTDMSNSQWQTGDYVWHYQTSPALVNGLCSGGGCPAWPRGHTPNWYWDTYPAQPGSNGGDLFDCSYDTYPSGNSCFIGS